MGGACIKSAKVKPADTERDDDDQPNSMNTPSSPEVTKIRRECAALVAGRHVTPPALQLPESSILAAEGGGLLQGLFLQKRNGFSLCSKEMHRLGMQRLQLKSRAGMFPKAEEDASLAEGINWSSKCHF